ncbi:MAG: GNAT family N-acetyltransferase [Clostridia bacterium]|nr:GNAT family N-acetyltransferase [Clostridia bacterium]
MLTLHEPTQSELWFRQAMLEDDETMSYNRAWGGAVGFPEADWADWYEYWIARPEGKRFYRYLSDGGRFVGEIAYHFDKEIGGFIADVIVYAPERGNGYGGAGLDLLCAAAKENGLAELYDDIASDNPAIGLFLRHGFAEAFRAVGKIVLKKTL